MHASALAKNRSIVVGVTSVASRGEITRGCCTRFPQRTPPRRGALNTLELRTRVRQTEHAREAAMKIMAIVDAVLVRGSQRAVR